MMKIKLFIAVLSVLSLVVATFILPCVVTAHVYGEHEALSAFILMFIGFAVPGAGAFFLTRGFFLEDIGRREGILLVFTTWLVISFLSAVPFYVTGVLPDFASAFFEASSGISTTGATVITDLENTYKSILLWRSLTHWLGGMGIIVLTVALLPLVGAGMSATEIFRAETSRVTNAKITPRIAQTAKILWLIYTGLTVICFIALKLGGMGVFDAINHAMSVISSGGFSTKNTSIGYFESPTIEWIFIAAMLVSAINFGLYYRLFTGQVVSVIKNSELRAYAFMIVTATAAIWLASHRGETFELRTIMFQVVSVTTTGCSTVDFTHWSSTAQLVLLGLMFVGGCAGSTAGGFKVVRMVVLFKQALNEMRLLVHPRGVFMLRLNGISINKKLVYIVFGFFFLYLFSILTVGVVASTAGMDMVTALTTGLATVSNLGTGLAGVGPSGSFAAYPDYVKWVLGIAMLAGRLEIYGFFILLMPFFWKK